MDGGSSPLRFVLEQPGSDVDILLETGGLAMNAWLVGLVVLLGSAIGVKIDSPHAQFVGLLVFGLVNGIFAFVLTAVIQSALHFFGVPGSKQR